MSHRSKEGGSSSVDASTDNPSTDDRNGLNGNGHPNPNLILPPLTSSNPHHSIQHQDQGEIEADRYRQHHLNQIHYDASQPHPDDYHHYNRNHHHQPQHHMPPRRRTAYPLEENLQFYPPTSDHPHPHHHPNPNFHPDSIMHQDGNHLPPPQHYHPSNPDWNPYNSNHQQPSFDQFNPDNLGGDSSSHLHQQEEVARTVLAPPPLLRNQACLSCRRRKMKCDAVRPVCGTCARSKAAAASAKQGHAPVPPGPCVYETVKPKVNKTATTTKRKRKSANQESSTTPTTSTPSQPQIDPGYVQQLEQRLRSMQEIIDRQHHPQQGPRFDGPSGNSNPRNRSFTEPGGQSNSYPSNGSNSGNSDYGVDNNNSSNGNWARNGGGSANGNGLRSVPATTIANDVDKDQGSVPVFGMLANDNTGPTKRVRRQFHTRAMPPPSTSSTVNNRRGSGNSSYSHLGPSPSDSTGGGVAATTTAPRISGSGPEPDPLLEILFPGYPSDLPSPDTVHHLAEIFFSRCPLSSAIHKPSFMTGLSLPMKHRQRPNEALVHAIMAVAAPLSPYFEGSRPSVKRERMNNHQQQQQQNDPYGNNLGRKELYDPRASSFAEFHLQRSQAKHARALTQPHSPLDRCHSGLICAYILWGTTRFVEAFTENAQVQRTLLPTGLTRLGLNRTKYRVPAIIPPPTCDAEEHERRLLFWWCYITDVYNGGAGFMWEPLLDDKGIITTLPADTALIQAGREPKPNPQTLESPDLFTTGHVDDFSLHVKSCILLKKVYLLHSRSPVEENHLRKPPGFKAIETSIMEFVQSFPPEDPFSPTVSVDRLLGWCNTQFALVLLHEPFITSPELECESYGKVSVAVNGTLAAVQKLRATSFDFGLLHPQLFLCWLVVGRMICKEIERQRRVGAPGEEAAAETLDALDMIISALYRAAEFIPCAARCFHLLQRFRSGKISEEMLGVCMYVEGLIPVDEDDILFPEDNLPSVPEALVQPQNPNGYPSSSDPRVVWQTPGYGNPSYYPNNPDPSMQYPDVSSYPSSSNYNGGREAQPGINDPTTTSGTNPGSSRPPHSNQTQSVEERYHNERSQTQMPTSLQGSSNSQLPPPNAPNGRNPQTYDGGELPVWTLHYGDTLG